MDNLQVRSQGEQSADSINSQPEPDPWVLARAAHVNLLLLGMPRVNLLLVGEDGVLDKVLETLLIDLDEPVASWRCGEHLNLPPASQVGTIILEDVRGLNDRDQQRLLDWLERAAGQTQVISTTPTRLLPQVEAGTFLDTLYYRLNTICVDVTPAAPM
jgi:hypothetical protein